MFKNSAIYWFGLNTVVLHWLIKHNLINCVGEAMLSAGAEGLKKG